MPHWWIKNRSEYGTQRTPLSVSSASGPTCERHHREVPGTLMTFLLIVTHPRPLPDGASVPFEEIIPHARHTCITMLSSGFSRSS
jgi:hypothetical protein